jgi:hypothetical protein
MSNVETSATEAYPLSDAEALERAGLLKRLGLKPGLPPDRPRRDGARRHPLGLAPAPPGPDDRAPVGDDSTLAVDSSYLPLVAEAFANISPEGRASPATVENTIDILDIAIRATFSGDDALHARIVKLELENARDKATIAELRSKLHEVDFIVERLRVENKGPPGVKGDRGRDGRDMTGPGARGERGPPGPPAPRIVSWEISDSDFVAYPLLSTGQKGPGLHLRGMFEVYNEQVNDTDAAAEIDAAARSREAARRELAAKDWANR